MNLYLLCIIILCLIGIKVYPKDFNKDYLSKGTTNCIKGIFILLVFFAHARTSIDVHHWYDNAMFYLSKNLSQLIVVMFLFYSGYGIYESFKKKRKKLHKYYA